MAENNGTPIESVNLQQLLGALKASGVETVEDLGIGIGLVKLKADMADLNQRITAERLSRDEFVVASQAREAALVTQRDELQQTINGLGI